MLSGTWSTLQRRYTGANFKDRSFEKDMMTLLVGVLPSITARNGVTGRNVVARAIEEYYHAGGHKSGSLLTRNRYEVAKKYGLSLEDTARYEVASALATLVNTAPATFWMLFFTYSVHGLLTDIRTELDRVVSQTKYESKTRRIISLQTIKEKCPLLISTVQETLRYCAIGNSVRQVMQDTVLDGQWLLRKDSLVQMPSRIIHTDASIWGTNVENFEPRRFLKSSTGPKPGDSSNKRAQAAAFRSFGGGTTLCPGRQFAMNEMLVITAAFVLQFDLSPVGGIWSMPTTIKSNLAAVVMTPDTDIDVSVSLRKGFESSALHCTFD